MGDLDAAGGDGDLEDGGDGDLEDGSDSEMDVDEADAAAYELCEASQDARDLAKASAASAAALEALEELDASGGKIRRRKGKMWGAYASAARRGAYEQSVSSCLFVRGGDEYQYMTQPLIGYVLFLAERLESAPVAAAATEGPTLASLVQRSLDVQSEVDEEEEGHPPRANLGSRDFPLNLAKAAALDEADATPGARHALMQAASEKLRSCADELLKFQTFLNEQQQKQFAAWASGNDDDASYNGPRVTWWETKTLTVLPPPFATAWGAACDLAELLLSRSCSARMGVPLSACGPAEPDSAPAAVLRGSFGALAREFAQDFKTDLRFTPAALALLQAAAEEHAVDFMAAKAAKLP
jgi:hypothetical protein